jgi:hypothetical protein
MSKNKYDNNIYYYSILMKRCRPGVLCIENITLFLIIIIFIVLGFLIYINVKENKNGAKGETINIEQNMQSREREPGISLMPSYPYNNLPYNNLQDVLLNPYAAPYRDERYFIPEMVSPRINIATNIGAVDTTYRQLGLLTPLKGTSKDNLLPLMGRPVFTNRDKWQYYTISNQHNNIKLPITFKGKSALNDYGVNQIYSRDIVHVEGNNEAYRVTMYENNTIKYLPFL